MTILLKRSLLSAAALVLIGTATAPVFAATHHAAASAQSLVTTQLPREVRPLHYSVSLVPNAKENTFTGTIDIDVEVLQATKSITVNALELDFSSATLLDVKKHALTAVTTVDKATQTASFAFEQPLAKGRYQLKLAYKGLIGTQAVGLFSLDYDSPEGKKRALYSQFENSEARRMIPSWDEPFYKASFALTVVVPSTDMPVSNMPIVKTTPLDNGLKQVEFAKSPIMSSYLLFFSTGDFERKSVMADGVDIGVITKKGSLSQADYALESSKAVLQDYNQYFGVRFPLPKLDNIAAPGSSQFFSAMENWGAIFTFENSLLLDPSISTQGSKQGVFSIAAHEIAHQWFGDLVTMQWWDDLWLNEGFASWMASRTTQKLKPEWDTHMDAVGAREGAMSRDAIATTHPIVQHIETVEQASQAFDSITYSKGEAVIRMLENYVGEDAWRNGVRAYMKKHAYKNTVSADFWKEIEKAAGKPISKIAHDFTMQPGVPMIQVDESVCKAGKMHVKLTQKEFSRDQADKKPLAWQVPVVAQIIGSTAKTRALVVNGSASMIVPGCGAVLLNAGQSGYYRTLYAPKPFADVASKFGELSPLDQVGVMSDIWELGLYGQQTISDYLDLTKTVPANASSHVWSDIAGNLASIHRWYKASPARQAQFGAFAIAKLSPQMEKLGWVAKAGEPAITANFRSGMIATLSELGDTATLAEARRRYAAADTDPASLPAAIRQLVTFIVARHADEITWDAMRNKAIAEKSPMIKAGLYRMLAATEHQALAKKALALALTDEPGVTNSASMIGGVAGAFPDMAFDFAIAHMAEVNARVDATSRSRYFPALGAGSIDLAMIDKLNAYAKEHVAEGSRREVDTAIARIKTRIKVRAERLPTIDAWLEKQLNTH